MKIKLTKDRKIKGKLHKEGKTIIVKKDYGERLISEGLANRIIADNRLENRAVASEGHRRFHSHTRFRG